MLELGIVAASLVIKFFAMGQAEFLRDQVQLITPYNDMRELKEQMHFMNHTKENYIHTNHVSPIPTTFIDKMQAWQLV